MSKNTGTLISAPIRPNSYLDTIATAYATEIKGGLHFATSSTDRDLIYIGRREWGMMCYVLNDNLTYQLEYNYSSTSLTDNGNWKVFSGSGGTGEWLPSVISIESTEPLTPSNGDRYILGPSPTGTNWGSLTQDDVVEWDSSVPKWTVTQPTDGTSVRVDNEDNAIYRYEGLYPFGSWQKDKESQVRYINATTPDGFSFSATSNPTFDQYDTESIFIVKFSGTNFGPTASLNINGLGEKLIKRAFGQSLTSLIPSDISLNYPYPMTFDGSNFIIVKPSEDTSTFNINYHLQSTDYITVPQNTLYWVYGDFIIDGGTLENYGQVVVTNGAFSFGTAGGTFSNYSSLLLNSFAEIDGTGQANYIPKWKTNYMMTATSSLYDDGSLVQVTGSTFSLLTPNVIIPTGASAGYVLTSDANGVATWQIAGSVNKFSITQTFTGGTTYSITHGLNTNDIVVNFWDDTSGELLIVNVKRTSLNAIDVFSAATVTSGRVVVMGG